MWTPWGPGHQGWEVGDWAEGGHCAVGLLLQPEAGWLGSTMFGKTTPGEAEARKKGCICSPPSCGSVCRSGNPPWQWARQGLSVRWPRALTSGSGLCVWLVSCLAGDEAHQSRAALPTFQGLSSVVWLGQSPGPRGRRGLGILVIEMC